jgi:hypothetical protein
MRPALVKQRRRLADGTRLVNVVCPACDGRHWLVDDHTGECPRRPATTFTITDPRPEKP